LRLCLDLIDAGIRIVQLDPEMVFDEESIDRDMTAIIIMIVTLSRGHGESAIKSTRSLDNWAKRRRASREKGETLTKPLPLWIEERDAKRELVPERAATLKYIYRLAAGGYGTSRF